MAIILDEAFLLMPNLDPAFLCCASGKTLYVRWVFGRVSGGKVTARCLGAGAYISTAPELTFHIAYFLTLPF
jgi:hypothetical protein